MIPLPRVDTPVVLIDRIRACSITKSKIVPPSIYRYDALSEVSSKKTVHTPVETSLGVCTSPESPTWWT